MTIQAKQKLVTDVAENIGDFLTVKDTRKVSAILTDQLEQYDLTEIKAEEISANTLDLLQMFLDAKRIEGRSVKTIERYSYILEKALRAIGTPAEQITVFQIRAYLMDEKKKGLQDSSIEGVRCVLSSFFSWSWKEGLLKNNPCANIGAVKCQKKIRLPFSAVDIEKLKTACKTARDKALVCFLLSSGARISEVCALNRDAISYDLLECTVLGKGNKERTVYIDEVTAMELRAYMSARKDNSPALFAGKGTERMTPHGVREMLTDLGAAAGVENVHPHRFRRTLATHLIDRGMAVQDVAYILGHEKLDTTMKYIFINANNVKSAYRRFYA